MCAEYEIVYYLVYIGDIEGGRRRGRGGERKTNILNGIAPPHQRSGAWTTTHERLQSPYLYGTILSAKPSFLSAAHAELL